MIRFNQSATITVDGIEIPGRSVTVPTGLDFDFTVSRKRFEPFADINVVFYNLSQNTFKLLNKKEDGPDGNFRNTAQIRCDAGYSGSNKLIFSGTVYTTRNQFLPGEKITNVKVSSYSNNLVDNKASLSYRKAPRFSQAIQELAQKAGVKVNLNRLKATDDRSLGQKSFSFEGTVVELIQLAASQNNQITAEFYNDIVIVSSIQVDQVNPIKTLNASNGMIRSPVLTDDNLVRVEDIFEPDYQIGAFLKVESTKFIQPEVIGEIYKIDHSYSTTSGATSTVELLPLGQAVPRNNLGVGP